MEEMPITTVVGISAFLAGLVFGATANKTNFCTMGALSDMVFMEDYNRLRAWFLATAVAILGTQALHTAEMIDVSNTIYTSASLGWAGAILGGTLFGFGMTMAGGCGNKTLVRIGGGNLKSVVVFLVMGIFAYMTMRGLIGLARVELESAANIDLAAREIESQSMVNLLAAMIGSEVRSLRWVVAGIVAGGLLIFCFKSAEFRGSGETLVGGLIIGLLVPVGWYISGVIGYDDFEPLPLTSFSFVAPAGESIQYLMTYTGATINFGIAATGGIITGSFIVALATKSFNWEAFSDVSDMMRHIIGGAIMGIGGVLALGCTVGQGITGMSTLAVGSVIALCSIIFGGVWGLKYLEEGELLPALKAVFSRE